MGYKKLKIEDLINKAIDGGNSPKEEYLEVYVKSYDSTIKLKKADNTLLLESLELGGENAHDGDIYLLYNSIVEPNIKDEELHRAYGIVRPVEIVDKLFSLGEVAGISKLLVKNAGFEDKAVELVENLKN